MSYNFYCLDSGSSLVRTFAGGTLMEMLSDGQVLLVNSGETVRLNCEFAADSRFNLFDNPVWWRKAQRHEETQVNMMGSVLQPFESTRRFLVAFHSRPPNYTLRLTITGYISVGLMFSVACLSLKKGSK